VNFGKEGGLGPCSNGFLASLEPGSPDNRFLCEGMPKARLDQKFTKTRGSRVFLELVF
jgi:hypothetical protein